VEDRNINAKDSHIVNNTISGNRIIANQGGNHNKIQQDVLPETPQNNFEIQETLEKLRIAVVDSKELSASEKLEVLKQFDILEQTINSPEKPEYESIIKKIGGSIIQTVGKLPSFLDSLEKLQKLLPILGHLSFPS
jgi:hypothetical protein